jgi:hypothetical protein
MEYYAVWTGKCHHVSKYHIVFVFGGISVRKVILLSLLDPEYEGTRILRNIENNLPAHCETPQETSTFNSKAVRTSNLACPTKL